MENKKIREINDENFDQEVLQSEEPVLIDFWASWCGPCQLMSPIIDELAEEYGSKARIGKLNVDGNMETPQRYQVRSVPTIILFHHGREIDRITGAISKSFLVSLLNQSLGKGDQLVF